MASQERYNQLPPENLRALLSALERQNKRKPTRNTMAEIRKVKKALGR